MNNLRIKSAISMMIVSLLMITGISFAQQGNGNGYGKSNGKNYHKNCKQMNKGEMMMNRIPDITDDQKAKIKTIRTESMKQMLPLKNEMNVLKAEKRALCTAEEVNIKAINKKIDAQSKIKADIMKLRAKARQDIRALLTDDQRIVFDMQSGNGNRGNGHGKGHKRNKGGCYKN
ncbi:MAG: hypothetical protein B6I18_00790 [Bacteroidetes bacterium 4572_112]|nr:MAG: hypothetical protein B6I18_00790 [Bacteroidetes bacterium 4572_112]